MVVWAYTRNILLPYVIYRIVTENMWFPEPFAALWPMVGFSAGFLTIMLFLHYYWYYLFVQMLLYYKNKGEAEDLQNDSRKTKKEQ
jgi:hypothetical protein